ncbi:MAG: hypothetical protein R3F62_27615 [Planctomycetota bacterium]
MRLSPRIAWLAALICASAAFAQDPAVVFSEESGKDEATNLEFEVHYVQVEGLESAAGARINQALRELAFAPKRAMQELLTQDPGESGFPGSNGVYVGTGVGVVSGELISVSLSVSTYYAGAAHPNLELSAVSFDARSGERVSPEAFFAGGAQTLLAPVARTLRAGYPEFADLFVHRPRVADLRSVVAEPEGLTFLWGPEQLGAPHVVGPLIATLTWAELGDLVDREGILRTAIAADPARSEDGLGGAPPAPDAEAYLIGLEDQFSAALIALTIEERLALFRDDAWRADAATVDEVLERLDASCPSVAARLRAAQGELRSNYTQVELGALSTLEAESLRASLDYALNNSETGRVLTPRGNPLLVRGEPQDAEDWGIPFSRLQNGAVVSVLAHAGEALFDSVLLPDGRVGRVHQNYLLIEAPVVDVQGRVYRAADGSLRFALPDGEALIAKDGPGHADRELAAIRSLIGSDGMSPPLNLVAIRRQIGDRPSWLAVVDFTDLSGEHPLGEGMPLDGVVGKLPE